jgi:7-cyano-7-deazaguanine synthase
MKRAVVLLSGGIDSSTTLAIAKAQGYELYALSLDYMQRHQRELESAKQVAEHLGVQKHLVIKFDLRKIGGSALTAKIAVPKHEEDIQASAGFHQPADIPVTYVPARNTIFLSFALAWAEVLEAADIFIGANAVDYSGYPDCRPEYLRAFEAMANLATKASVTKEIWFQIDAPLISLTKAEIIKKGLELNIDYGLTWSCYDPQPQSRASLSGLVPCGRCDSCFFRAEGFKEAGIKDPLNRYHGGK